MLASRVPPWLRTRHLCGCAADMFMSCRLVWNILRYGHMSQRLQHNQCQVSFFVQMPALHFIHIIYSCNNEPGQCRCNPGWSGPTCNTAVNLCATDNGGCSPFATCISTLGSFSCGLWASPHNSSIQLKCVQLAMRGIPRTATAWALTAAPT